MNSAGLKLLTTNLDRLIFSLLLVAAAYYLPLWLLVVVSCIGIVVFSYYLEAALVVFLIELMFGLPPHDTWSPYVFIATISLLLTTVVVEEIKNLIFVNRR